MAKAIGDRNEVECSFGTDKRIYRADNIQAKLPNTAECWTGMCYFVKNVMKFLRELCLRLFKKSTLDFILSSRNKDCKLKFFIVPVSPY